MKPSMPLIKDLPAMSYITTVNAVGTTDNQLEHKRTTHVLHGVISVVGYKVKLDTTGTECLTISAVDRDGRTMHIKLFAERGERLFIRKVKDADKACIEGTRALLDFRTRERDRSKAA